jgi:cyclic pyranopterin phosphate synthase
MEWSSPYNSFNSMKGLCFIDKYQEIIKGKIPNPIQASVEINNYCNLYCVFCNSKLQVNEMPKNEININILEKMVNSLMFDIDVKGFCFFGGEPMLYIEKHKEDFYNILYNIKNNNRHSSIVTNGTVMSDKSTLVLIDTCRWIGISVDASNRNTFSRIKECNPILFDTVINNCKKIVKQRSQNKNSILDLCFKFLWFPGNYKEIYEACLIARDIGFRDFHARPAGGGGFFGLEDFKYDNDMIKNINSQLDKIRDLESEDFKVYGITHIFDPNFKKKNNFKKCLASPLTIQVCCDGNIYQCVDSRYKQEKIIGNYLNELNIKKIWGSKKHKEVINKTNPSNCPRCMYSEYHKQVEEIKKDSMCLYYP